MNFIKRFVLWADKRTPSKQKEKNWDRYFRGQIEV